jgi:hypothetical protein
MKELLFMLLGLSGILCGVVLYRLPSWLFFRHSAWLTQEELRAAFPEKEWVPRVQVGLVVVGFYLFAPLVLGTDVTREINWFLLPVVAWCWMGALPALPELIAKVSFLVLLGKHTRRPVLYTVGPNAVRAGVFRLAMASLIVAVFLWCR